MECLQPIVILKVEDKPINKTKKPGVIPGGLVYHIEHRDQRYKSKKRDTPLDESTWKSKRGEKSCKDSDQYKK